jgi:hypothetical protein
MLTKPHDELKRYNCRVNFIICVLPVFLSILFTAHLPGLILIASLQGQELEWLLCAVRQAKQFIGFMVAMHAMVTVP